MTLEEYRSENCLTIYDLGRMFGLDPSSVSRLCRGERMPSTPTMDAIMRETKGAVTYNDFRATVIGERTKPGGKRPTKKAAKPKRRA